MTAPVPEPPMAGDERETLVAFLDYYRAVMLDKASGLTREEMGRRLGPSTLTLAGLVYHLAVVEESWFSRTFAGNEIGEPWASVDWKTSPDWEFDVAPDLDPEEVLDAYRRACVQANEVIAAAGSLDDLAARKSREGESISLRWILVHMIEETARHAGHADLIRESIDGEVGDFRGD